MPNQKLKTTCPCFLLFDFPARFTADRVRKLHQITFRVKRYFEKLEIISYLPSAKRQFVFGVSHSAEIFRASKQSVDSLQVRHWTVGVSSRLPCATGQDIFARIWWE